VEPLNVDIKECARILGLGITNTKQLIRTGEILSIRHGRRVLVPRVAIDEYEAARIAEARADREDAQERAQRRRQFQQRRPA